MEESKGNNKKQKQNEREREKEEEEINKYLLGIMEGYSDSVIPPLSLFSPQHHRLLPVKVEVDSDNDIDNNNNNNNSALTSSSRKRKCPLLYDVNYALLQSLLPNDHIFANKVTREGIVNGAIDYIKNLEKELSVLDKLKKSFESIKRNTTIGVNVNRDVAFFGIHSFARRGLVTQIFMVFEKHKAQVLSANVTVNKGQLTVAVTATVNGRKANSIEKIKNDILLL